MTVTVTGGFDPLAADEVLRAVCDADGPGIQLAISCGDEVVYSRGRGLADLEHRTPITADTVFHVASVSKQVTAFAVALLAERGALDLDAGIRDYLPRMPECADGVTVRQLVHHTSGLRDQWMLALAAGWRIEDVITRADILDLVHTQRELNFPPGSRYLYSNTGYTLLAELVTTVSGLEFPAFCRRELFEPLGMHSTQFCDDHRRVVAHRSSSYLPAASGSGYQRCPLNYATVGATSLLSTAGDLLRWAANHRHARVGGPRVRDLAHTSGVLTDATPTGYAFGLILDEYRGHRRFGHGGSDAGFRAQLVSLPELGLSIAALSNLATADPAKLCERLADLVIGAPPDSTPPATVRPVGAYVGTYADSDTGECLDLTADAGTLTLRGVGPLEPTGADRFRHGPAELRFDAATSPAGSLTLTVVSQGPRRLTRIHRREPAPAELAELAGRYRSPELDVDYTVRSTDATLVLHRRKLTPMPLEPAARDGFTGSWGDPVTPVQFAVVFDRTDGVVSGLRLSMARLANLRLHRVDTGNGDHP
ncbi:MAG TPA: serine hydrolase [Mycobacteriales bacterium]|nr:serine hydrolase [Mycobacteriales bacterium]